MADTRQVRAEALAAFNAHDETLSGPAGDIPATHRRLEGRGAQILRVSGGKIVEEYLYFDQVQVLAQLGLMPEPAAAQA